MRIPPPRPSASCQPLAQRAALDVGHNIVKEPARLAGIVHGEDVRVGESRHDLDFVEEPLDSDDRGEAGEQHLERDLALMPGVVGQIHAGHAAAAEQAAELEPPGQLGIEVGRGMSVGTGLEYTACLTRRLAQWSIVAAATETSARSLPSVEGSRGPCHS